MLKGKINVKSHKNYDKKENDKIDADVKFQICADRLRKIIEDIVVRLKILIKVPWLFHEEGAEAMRKFLGDASTDFILKVCQEYCSNLNLLEAVDTSIVDTSLVDITVVDSTVVDTSVVDTSVVDTSVVDTIAVDTSEVDTSIVHTTAAHTTPDAQHFSRAIRNINAFRSEKPPLDFGFDKFRISQVAHLIMDSKELVEYLEKNVDIINTIEKKFLWCMETLRDIICENLQTTGMEQRERHETLRDAYRNLLILTTNIKELEHELKEQLAELKLSHQGRLGVVEDLESQINTLNEEYEEQVKKLVYKSEKAMMQGFNVSEQRQAELTARVEEDTVQYEAMLATNLKEETSLRVRKSKIEMQVAGWVAKYDQDIGEKQTQLEHLEKMYNQERRQLDQLSADFEDQAEEYDFLMAERDAEELKIFEEVLFKFVRRRAARIIQRAWRAYLKRKALRKKRKGKDKKGKDKKKEKKTTAYVKALEKREREKQEGAKEKEKTLEQKYGDDMFTGLKNDDPSVFTNKEKEVKLS